MGQHGANGGVRPEFRGRVAKVRNQHGRNPHQGSISCRLDLCLMPWFPVFAVEDELPNRAADAENLLTAKRVGDLLRSEFSVFENLLQRPERQLRVIGRVTSAVTPG